MKQPTATIVLHRRLNPVQPLLAYTVEVDRRSAAQLAVAQRRAIEVSPGRHRVQAKVLWMSSRPVDVDVEPGGSLTVEVGPDVRHLWKMVTSPKTFLHVEAERSG